MKGMKILNEPLIVKYSSMFSLNMVRVSVATMGVN